MSESRHKGTWAEVSFGDVVRLSKERSSDPLTEGFERYVGLEHIEPNDLRIRSWGDVADGTTFTSVFRPGQVLFGKRRAYQRKIAVADFTGVCSGDIYVLEPCNSKLLSDLLPFICQTDRFFEHAIGTSAGSLSPRTNWKSLSEYEFALPPLEEQRRIVEVLNAVERATRATKIFGEQQETMSLSLLNQLAPPVKAMDSASTRLDELANIQMGFAFKSSDYCEAGVQLLRIGALYNARFDAGRDPVFLPAHFVEKHREFLVAPGDVVMSLTGGVKTRNLGYAVEIPDEAEPMLLNQRVVRIAPKRPKDRAWLLAILTSSGLHNRFRRTLTATAQANVSVKDLAAIRIPVMEASSAGTLDVPLSLLRRCSKGLVERLEHLRGVRAAILRDALNERRSE